MPKLIGIVGSPRKGGNTEYLVNLALKAAREEGIETELIPLAGREIKPCDGCRVCKKTGECHIKDDLKQVFERMLGADGIILASPVYFGSATPQIKALMDRVGTWSGHFGRPFENKVGGSMAVARRAGQNFTIAQLAFFFLITGMIMPGSTYWNMGFGDRAGEIEADREGHKTAVDFGRNIAWLMRVISETKVPKPKNIKTEWPQPPMIPRKP